MIILSDGFYNSPISFIYFIINSTTRTHSFLSLSSKKQYVKRDNKKIHQLENKSFDEYILLKTFTLLVGEIKDMNGQNVPPSFYYYFFKKFLLENMKNDLKLPF